MATAEKAIYDRLAAAPTFHPASAALFANDWALDAGDVVAVKSGEDTFSVPIYGMTLDWKGNSMVEIQSTGNEERKPISALKRRQFASGRGRYRQEKEIDGYYQRLIEEHGSMGLISGALGVVLDADGNPVTDPTTGKLVYDENSPAELFSRLLTTPNYAELVSALNNGTQQISGAKINLSSQGSVLIQAINNRPSGESSVTIDADKINLTGYVTATALDTRLANVDQLFTTTGYAGTIYATNVSATGTLSGQTGDFTNVYARNYYVTDAAGNTDYQLGNAVTAFGTPTASSGQISIPFYTSAHPSSSSTPAGTINFNIADTAYYQSHVGISAVSPASAWDWDSNDGYSMTVTATAKNGTTKTCGVEPPIISLSANLGTSATTAVHCYGPAVSGNQHALATQYSLYLKADNDYCYITKDNNEATVGTNVLARITNPKPDGKGTVTALTVSAIGANATKDSGIAVGVTGTNLNAFTADSTFSLNSTTYAPSASALTTQHCVNLKHGTAIIGRINVEAVYTSGVSAGEAKFSRASVTKQGSSVSVLLRDSSGGVYLRGDSVNRSVNGTLMYQNGVSAGTGSWFLLSGDSSTTRLYKGNGTRYKYYTAYEAGSTDTTTYYTKTS